MAEAELASKQIVFVGLGNPGNQYVMTRHNIGFMVVSALAEHYGLRFKKEERFQAAVAKGKSGEMTIHLLMPLTYMNLSGSAVRRYLDFYQLGPRHVVVVNDDVALPFGEMRLRIMGSAGGHNGLKSLEAHLHTRHYARLRMGVGAGAETEELADYVLGQFSQEEQKSLQQFVARGAQVLERLVTEDIHCVMNVINMRNRRKSNTPAKGQENKHE